MVNKDYNLIIKSLSGLSIECKAKIIYDLTFEIADKYNTFMVPDKQIEKLAIDYEKKINWYEN